MTNASRSLLEFPCFYTFKVFGHRTQTFAERVRGIVASTLGTVPLDSMKVRESSGGRYLSVTIEMRVYNREQLERVYEDLRAEAEVLLYI
jgi:putative lipoic acid-binding regulatory protein